MVGPLQAIGTQGWYGNLPQPSVTSVEGFEMVFDPLYALPAFLYAIKTYIAIFMLLPTIDPKASTLDQLLADTPPGQGLPAYTEWLKSQYQKAVSGPKAESKEGLVKSDLPTVEDIVGFAESYSVIPVVSPSLIGALNWPTGEGIEDFPASYQRDLGEQKTGHAWNCVYGVVNTCSVFPEPTPISSAPSCIIDIYNTDTIGGIQTNESIFRSLVCPWVRARVALGLMARWKALYLFLGYDAAWSVLQYLRKLTNQQPDDELTLPDGTKANGDWSIRELFTTLNQVLEGSAPVWPDKVGRVKIPSLNPLSLSNLMLALDMIAKGNWSGPAIETSLTRPVSFRDRLAAAAL